MTFSNAAPDALFQILDAMALGRHGEQSAMDIFGTEPPGALNDNLVPFFFPLQHRTRTYTKFPPHIQGNGNLPLGSELRMRYGHIQYYLGNGQFELGASLTPMSLNNANRMGYANISLVITKMPENVRACHDV